MPTSMPRWSPTVASLAARGSNQGKKGRAVMTDQQFNSLILHLRALIVLLGLLTGIVLAIEWQLI